VLDMIAKQHAVPSQEATKAIDFGMMYHMRDICTQSLELVVHTMVCFDVAHFHVAHVHEIVRDHMMALKSFLYAQICLAHMMVHTHQQSHLQCSPERSRLQHMLDKHNQKLLQSFVHMCSACVQKILPRQTPHDENQQQRSGRMCSVCV